jgi:hypothetical protein
VVREKIKKHLLGQITQMRNKGGRRTTRKDFDEQAGRNVTELFQEAMKETTRAIGAAIDRTLGVTGATIQAANDVAETVTARTAEMIRPERTSEPVRPQAVKRRSAAKESAPKKAARKTIRSGTKPKAAGKTKRAGGTKKTASKKNSRKR